MPATKHGPDKGGIREARINILLHLHFLTYSLTYLLTHTFTFRILILTAFAFALLYQVLISHIFMTGFTEVKGPGNVN